MTGFHFKIWINGNGYFKVQNPIDDTIMYTRNATFYLNSQNQVVTIEGFVMIPTITFPERITSAPQVSTDWILTYSGQQIEQQIEIAKFSNPTGLVPFGFGLGYYLESPESWNPQVGYPGANYYWSLIQGTGSSAVMNFVHIGIHGNGYFQVQNPDWSTLYTRNNIFHINNQGRLVTLEWYILYPSIILPQPIESTTTQIGMNGMVSFDHQGVGVIQLAKFINPADLTDVWSWYYAASNKSWEPSVSNPHTNGMGLLVSELSYQNSWFNFAMGITGNWYFQIQDPDGSILYTRNNTFYLNNQNQLSTKEWLLLSPTITFAESITQTPEISSDGTIMENNQEIGHIQLAVFTNPAGLTESDLGLGYYKVTYKSGSPLVGNPGVDIYGSLVFGSKSSPLILGIDVSITGNWYFQVQNYDGTTLYTRNGNFLLNPNGELVTTNGDIVQPGITFPIGSLASTHITSEGDVSVANGMIGNIQLATFANPAGLLVSNIRSEYYTATQNAGSASIGSPGQWGKWALTFRFKTSSSISPTVNLDPTPSCSVMTLTITGNGSFQVQNPDVLIQSSNDNNLQLSNQAALVTPGIGDGYFQVQNPDDETIMYTRNTIFQLDNQGRIVTPEWYVLMPGITLPNAIDKNTLITNRGVVTEKIQGVQYGTIQLAKFADPNWLNAIGQGYYTETEDSGTPTVGTPGEQGFGILHYNNICGVAKTISLIPDSDNPTDTINAMRDNGYTLIGNDLVWNWDISLEETCGAIPTTINLRSNNIRIHIPQGIRFMKADYTCVWAFSPPIITDTSLVAGETILSSFKIGDDLQSITMTGGVVTIYVPMPDYAIGDVVRVYYSHNGWLDWQRHTTTRVTTYDEQPYVIFTTDHFTDFSVTLPGGTLDWTFVINNDDTSTVSLDTTFSISFLPVDPIYMRFSNDAINRGNWENYATTFPWTLSNDYGNKTVYAEFDADGDYNGDISTNDSINYIDPIVEHYYWPISLYTTNWTSNACDATTMISQEIAPWTDQIPDILNPNTIYVLLSWSHITSRTITMATCSAVVGSGNVMLYSNATLTGGMINIQNISNFIVDNVGLDGQGNGDWTLRASWCTDPSYTDQIACEVWGWCSDPNYLDQTSCTDAGYCSCDIFDSPSTCESVHKGSCPN